MKKNTKTLSFSLGNAKLSKDIATFSLPCGWSCPFARDCKTRVGRNGGFVEKGHKIRCYAATSELLFSVVRKARWRNFDLLRNAKTISKMADLIHNSLPQKDLIRISQSGDFYSQNYFDAWIEVAKRNPSKLFYAYTKAIPYILKRPNLPANFKLVASYGGKFDHLIKKNHLQFAKVVFSEDEAKREGLKISHDDKDAYQNTSNLGILLHGQQSAGPAAKAWHHLYKTKQSGYQAKYGLK